MIERLLKFFRNNPGLILLSILIVAVFVTSTKPLFYLVGWDNYSSYFNGKTNLFRTIFATWRDFRGVGVPSDSENTDVFRQLFFYLTFFVPLELKDQLYLLLSFATGIIGMYFLSKKIIFQYVHRHINPLHLEIAAGASAFFYACNLNTLSTFYFPMIMFVNRFAMLPILTYIMIRLHENKKMTKKEFVMLYLALLAVSGSFLVATIFITTMIALGIFAVTQRNLKRSIISFLFISAAYAFWILPFLNYTIEKSGIIRLAPTFIEANETQLNKPKTFFSFVKQTTLYPNFFETNYVNQETQKQLPFHPLSDSYDTFPVQSILSIFVLLYLTGIILTMRHAFVHRTIQFLWIPGIILLFLFLSLKEFSPLGFLYAFFSNTIPYFNVLFRFGDTKFHTFISFAGSLSAGITVLFVTLFIIQQWRARGRVILSTFLALITLSTLFVFRSYFTGNFIGFFMYNRIPEAYFQLADTINHDSGTGRVLHLPTSRTGYWKSYAWGTVGSSFFHYMLDKPFVDRTFEPASVENAQLNQQLYETIANFQSIEDPVEKQKWADSFAQLLNLYGIEYVIIDESVTAEAHPRGIDFWGIFNLVDSQAIVTYLEDKKKIILIDDYSIDLKDYTSVYKNFYPTENISVSIPDNSLRTIQLYKVPDISKQISFVEETTNNDPAHTTITTSSIMPSNVFVQDKNNPSYIFYPFKRNDATITLNDGFITSTIPRIFSDEETYQISTSESGNNRSTLINVFSQQSNDILTITLYEQVLPDINGQSFQELVKTVEVPRSLLMTNPNIRLRVDDQIISVPSDLTPNRTYLASIMVHDSVFQVTVLNQYINAHISADSFSFTENPNCFFDKLDGFLYEKTAHKNSIDISTRNGSVCLWQSLKNYINEETSYAEIRFDAFGSSTDLDATHNINAGYTSKPKLKKAVLSYPKPNILSACVQEPGSESCLNTNQLFMIQDHQSVTVPIEKIEHAFDPLILMGLKQVSFQESEMALTDMNFDLYRTIVAESVSLPLRTSYVTRLSHIQSENIMLNYPVARSRFSRSYDPETDGVLLSNNPCQEKNSYRTFRVVEGRLLSYFENCDNQIIMEVPFRSNNFYVWLLDYNLLSGKFPQFQVRDDLVTYKDELVSLYQGYPDIEEFQKFQNPEIFTTLARVKKKLSETQTKIAYTYIEPHPEYLDSKNKQFVLHQDSENEGALLVDNAHIVEIPTAWNNLKIEPVGGTAKEYTTPQSFDYEKILPSLWRVNVSNLQPTTDNLQLLKFNEGYDRQWHMFSSKLGLFFGRGIEENHVKCNGFANCFEMTPKAGEQTYYIFYTPERLNFLGWGITLTSFFVFGWFFTQSRKSA